MGLNFEELLVDHVFLNFLPVNANLLIHELKNLSSESGKSLVFLSANFRKQTKMYSYKKS